MTARSGTNVERAVQCLLSGGVIGLPTETVYGLAADAHDPAAVAEIYRVKGRPMDHPLIVHVPDLDSARAWSDAWPPSAEVLARAFWPGPLTLIVPMDPHLVVERGVTGGRDSVAVRVPRHPMAQELLRRFPGGLAAPSANRFGRVSPTTARHVLDDLGDDVDYVLDGGPCEVGVESTIVDCTTSPVQVLRDGSVTREQIESVVGSVAGPSGPSRASGMMTSHYAPACRVQPVDSMHEANEGVAACTGRTRILDGTSDPDRFAHDLYALLRLCDEDGIDVVFIVAPADRAIGRAIRDRIFKAAATRPE